jgi:serine/threonine protein kinase
MSASQLLLSSPSRRVPPDPLAPAADDELRAHVERALSAHYELDCEIGRGGMGIIYRAKDRRLKRQVAIKLLPPELAFRSEIKSRFLREAETAAQLSHPNIVPIYTVDEVEQLVFFVMAYVSGDNLAKRLHERGVLGVDETRKVLREVGDALAYAHDRGVVHRDIKPDNILLDAVTGRPMVTDFGIARAMDSTGDSRLTATGMAIGTPAYMSPEQAAGEREIDGRSDLYSLGILGYQMLTGEPPFTAGSTPAMLVKHISERPIPVQQRRGDVPDDLANCVMTLLEKDPAHRFATATALVEALDTRTAPALRADVRSQMGPSVSARPAYTPRGYQEPAGSFEPRPYVGSSVPLAAMSADDMRNWEHPKVVAFRRKIAPYLFVNSVILLFALFGSRDFLTVSVLWSIYIAFKYAKLWSDGYDWRDVFRQPRDRELMEVAEEFGEQVHAIFDSKARAKLRAGREQRKLIARSSPSSVPSGFANPAATPYGLSPVPTSLSGALGDRVRKAFEDRQEILRRLDTLQGGLEKEDREEMRRSAIALGDRVQGFALALEELGRQDIAGAREQLESEITMLENAANPLERGSEERVRRLAFLKRKRRALIDTASRKDATANKLETCALALQDMRYSLSRLDHAGAHTPQRITSLANQAIRLAGNVDDAVAVADEMGRLGKGSAQGRRPPAERG